MLSRIVATSRLGNRRAGLPSRLDRKSRRLFDPRSCLGADMQTELARITAGKSLLTQEKASPSADKQKRETTAQTTPPVKHDRAEQVTITPSRKRSKLRSNPC